MENDFRNLNSQSWANLSNPIKTGMLTPRRVKCSFGEKAFATCAPLLWNALPSNVRNAKSLESFKSGLKTHLFSSYFN